MSKGKKRDPRSLEQFVDDTRRERFDENADIARSARILRSALTEKTAQLEALQKKFDLHTEAIQLLRESRTAVPIVAKEGAGTSEATAIAMATDWHYGSRVYPKQVNNHNEFNVEIATKRITTFFERTVRLIRKEQQDVHIKNLILFLGGDLINGSLHRDTDQSDEIAQPMYQASGCQDLIESGLNFLLNHGGVDITVLCCDGNHGRVTQKQHYTSRQGNALEYYMYANIARRFPQLKWVMDPSLLIYQQVYNWNIRFHHGDTIHFGGIKGPHEYITRSIFFWDTFDKASYTVQGHLHNYDIGSRRWLVNGSLIGPSPFGIAMHGEYQPPIQSFFLIDKLRGPTVQIPILL